MKGVEKKNGQFDLDDGGSYIGGWDGNMAVGLGVCTDPDGQGTFRGTWYNGFEVSGVKTWNRDNSSYAGQWTQGKKHGLGVEKRGHWLYQGEWTQGSMGRYGVRKSTKSNARYEGTWTLGLQDGYGMETYADLGTYQGQWLRGSRHGFGVRKSAVYSKSSFIQDHGKRRSSLTSTRSSYDVTAQGTPQSEVMTVTHEKFHLDSDMMKATKIGHFLASAKFCASFKRIQDENSDKKRSRSMTLDLITGSLRTKLGKVDDKGNSIKFKKGVEPGKNLRTKESTPFNFHNKGFHLDTKESEDDTTEIYAGDWKADKRDGHGVCERSDGTKYEGQWTGNRRNGFGITYYPGNIQDAGFYKDDVLLSGRKKNALLNALTIAKTKKEQDRVMAAVMAARKAAQMANQKSDIANSRMESARSKALLAEDIRKIANKDSEKAKVQAEEMMKASATERGVEDKNKLSTKTNAQQNQRNITNNLQQSRNQKLQNQLNQKNQKFPQQNQLYQQQQQNQPQLQQQQYQQQLQQYQQQYQQQPYQQQQNQQQQSQQFNQKNQLFLNQQNQQLNNQQQQQMQQKQMQQQQYSSTQQSNIANKAIRPDSLKLKSQQRTLRQNQDNMMMSVTAGAESMNNMNTNLNTNMNNNLNTNLKRERSNYGGNIEDFKITSVNLAEFRNKKLPIQQQLLQEQQYATHDEIMTNLEQQQLHNASQLEKIPIQRRLTLPNIVKCKDLELPDETRMGGKEQLAGRKTSGGLLGRQLLPEKVSEANVIIRDGGGREIVEEEVNLNAKKVDNFIDVDEGWFENKPRDLQTVLKTYQIKAPRKYELGSTPNISKVKRSEVGQMSWKELSMMNRAVKEEMRVMMEARLKKRALVIRFGDLFNWIYRNFALLTLIGFNFVIFYHLALLLVEK